LFDTNGPTGSAACIEHIKLAAPVSLMPKCNLGKASQVIPFGAKVQAQSGDL